MTVIERMMCITWEPKIVEITLLLFIPSFEVTKKHLLCCLCRIIESRYIERSRSFAYGSLIIWETSIYAADYKRLHNCHKLIIDRKIEHLEAFSMWKWDTNIANEANVGDISGT